MSLPIPVPARATECVRVPTLRPLSNTEFVVCALLGIKKSYYQIAAELQIARGTVKVHAERAARKIPGDMPLQAKCMAWVRGASLDVLDGRAFKIEMVEHAAIIERPRHQRPSVPSVR